MDIKDKNTENNEYFDTQPLDKNDLIYQIEDRPPFKESVFAALQHLPAIFAAIITPPLIISKALGITDRRSTFRN